MGPKESRPIIERGAKVGRAGAAFLSILASVASGPTFAGPKEDQKAWATYRQEKEDQQEEESMGVNCELAQDQVKAKGLTPKAVHDLKYLCPAPIVVRVIKENSKKPKAPIKK